MRSHIGQPGVLRLLLSLQCSVDEAERRVAEAGPSGSATVAELGRLAKATLERLQPAHARKVAAVTELHAATVALDDLLPQIQVGHDRVRSGVIGLYGPEPDVLAAFGCRPPRRKPRRRTPEQQQEQQQQQPQHPTQQQGPAGPPDAEPASTAGANAAHAVERTAEETSHHG